MLYAYNMREFGTQEKRSVFVMLYREYIFTKCQIRDIHLISDTNGYLIKGNCFIINNSYFTEDKYKTYLIFNSLTLCKKKYKYVNGT